MLLCCNLSFLLKIETIVDEDHIYSDDISTCIMEDGKHSDVKSLTLLFINLIISVLCYRAVPTQVVALHFHLHYLAWKINYTGFTCTGTLLLTYSFTVLDESSEYNICIDRSSDELFWAGLVAFYKGAISNPEKLQKKLVVTFVGTAEIGSNCGSLQKDFLNMV